MAKRSKPSPIWSYAPAPETAEVRVDKQCDLFINGEFRAPASGKRFKSVNPGTGRQISLVRK